MGEDGLAGLHAIRAAGGAHHRAGRSQLRSCLACPAAAIEAGLADAILPLDMVAPRLRSVIAESQSSEGASMTKLLVVEDSPTQAAELAFLLESEGFDVEIARNG